jgi:hypothetical protein
LKVALILPVDRAVQLGIVPRCRSSCGHRVATDPRLRLRRSMHSAAIHTHFVKGNRQSCISETKQDLVAEKREVLLDEKG